MNSSGLKKETIFAGLDEYPKEITLRNGMKVTFRPMVPGDQDSLSRFVSTLPENERIFLRDDIINPDMISSRVHEITDADALTILAVHGEDIVGCARIRRYPFAWNRHIGNIRFTISPAFRRQGLARTLLGELFCKALPSGIEKVIAEVVRGQDDALNALIHLGFTEEAILSNHHLDPKGSKHDVYFMSSDLNHLWDRWLQYSESISGTWDMED